MEILYRNYSLVAYMEDGILHITDCDAQILYAARGVATCYYDRPLRDLAASYKYILPYDYHFVNSWLQSFDGHTMEELCEDMAARAKKATMRSQMKKRRDELYNNLPEDVRYILISVDETEVYSAGINVYILLRSMVEVVDTKSMVSIIRANRARIDQFARDSIALSSVNLKTPRREAIVLPMCKLDTMSMESRTVLVLHYQLKDELINVLESKGDV